jgi:hypothetical protein
MNQIHKKFSNEQVKEMLDKYEGGVFKRQIIEQLLGIGQSQFFNLLKEYRDDRIKFSIDYIRRANTNEIDDDIED